MPSLSKKYKINYNKHYTTSKNKKQRGRKSIKVYHNRVKPMSRKRKHYMGGDIEAPAINNIFPSGQSYQPNTNCLEKECDKKDDAGEKTTTCLNTRIVMNLFRQTLDDSELATMDRIDYNFTAEERNHVKDLTEKYITGEMLVILIGTSFYMQQPLGVFMETPFYDYHELLQSAD